jgi:hypothetical protein
MNTHNISHFTGPFLQVTPGMRTTCAIRDGTDSSSPIHCWGGRADELLDRIKGDSNGLENNATMYHQISLGKDHACAVSKLDNKESTSSSYLQCWWLAGSDFDAHKVPVGLELVL